MLKNKAFISVPISFFMLACSSVISSTAHAGSMGVDIYCVMRNGGNNHEQSWKAAYHSIKTERGGLFKTSPRQAATMIVNAVVRDKDKYKDCISYLGDLFPDDSQIPISKTIADEPIKQAEDNDYAKERYSY